MLRKRPKCRTIYERVLVKTLNAWREAVQRCYAERIAILEPPMTVGLHAKHINNVNHKQRSQLNIVVKQHKEPSIY